MSVYGSMLHERSLFIVSTLIVQALQLINHQCEVYLCKK